MALMHACLSRRLSTVLTVVYDVSLHAVARQPRFHVSRSSRHIMGK